MTNPQSELEKIQEKIRLRREKVFELLDENAYRAAQTIVNSMDFYGEDSHEFQTQRLRMEAADSVLDMAGYKIKRTEVTGKDGKDLFEPLKILVDEGESAA